ncbi:sigma-70 family RNA polymerase sigma factor [Diaphorobacter caeni]|uniref:sigma-70 family RNA polymerase sigma factor n=1 Tax=Diaphorobacter caeni TaxID=2784387 RepID=UPI0038996B15
MISPADHSASHTLGSMYVQHNPWLLSWLHRRLGHGGDAADIAQDVFMRMWKMRASQALEEIREPRAYLTTMAKRMLANHLERRSLERAYLESLQQLPEAATMSVEDQAILLETLLELDALLHALPDKVRTAFLLAQLDGLAYEEIAAQLQVSLRTVTRYIAQGFKQCLCARLNSTECAA